MTPATPSQSAAVEAPKKFYVVWCPEHGPFTVRHPEFRFAQREASRLAAVYPGQAFYVLSAKSVIVAGEAGKERTFLRRSKSQAAAEQVAA